MEKLIFLNLYRILALDIPYPRTLSLEENSIFSVLERKETAGRMTAFSDCCEGE